MNCARKWRRSILVTGHGRGGTTWLGNLLRQAANVAYIFEPLTQSRHEPTSQSETLRAVHQSRDFWMSRDVSTDARGASLAAVVRDHILELYKRSFGGSIDTLVIKQPGIEWVPLLRSAVEPEYVVYVERHPFAILNSYNRSNLYDGWGVEAEFESCLRETAEDWPQLHRMLQCAGADRDLRILAMACAAHRVARMWSDGNRFVLLSYEKLAFGGVGEARKLADQLHLSFPDPQALVPFFFPEHAQHGFLDTKKHSAKRAEAYLRELAPWQLRKAKAYLDEIGFDYPDAPQDAAARFGGTMEYVRRALRRADNAGRARLSAVRNTVNRVLAIGAGSR